jgi:hypothetical protein
VRKWSPLVLYCFRKQSHLHFCCSDQNTRGSPPTTNITFQKRTDLPLDLRSEPIPANDALQRRFSACFLRLSEPFFRQPLPLVLHLTVTGRHRLAARPTAPRVTVLGARKLPPELRIVPEELLTTPGECLANRQEDGIENGLATGSGDFAEHMVELQVHLAERLLHVQNVLGGHLQQTAAVPPQGTKGTDRLGWPEACPQQCRISFAPRSYLHMK